jgi:hypothetical protein
MALPARVSHRDRRAQAERKRGHDDHCILRRPAAEGEESRLALHRDRLDHGVLHLLGEPLLEIPADYPERIDQAEEHVFLAFEAAKVVTRVG